uniref:Anoctamin transmembrane domain-containing protein n=1 Tax=Florenciella parvula TaxID=236787 RepID=A0A7S2G4I0_9STRA
MATKPKNERKGSFFFPRSKSKSNAAAAGETAPLVPKAKPIESTETIHYDLCFVFINPEHEDHKNFKGCDTGAGDETINGCDYKHFISKLLHVGLKVHTYLSIQGDEVYVQVGAPLERFKAQAALLDYKVKMDPKELEKATALHFEKVLKDDPSDTIDGKGPHLGAFDGRFGTYDYIFCKYEDEDEKQPLYAKGDGLSHPFHSTHRIKLLVTMIQGETFRGGADINIGACMAAKEECEDTENPSGGFGMLEQFPLHDPAVVNDLYKKWVVKWQWPWDQPVEQLRMYLGEKAGLYFGFLVHYTAWLMGIAVFGLIVQIDTYIEYSIQASTVPYFAVFVCVWAVLMLEDWKNKEATYALKWGMSDFESTEQDRPEFNGNLQWSPVDGEKMTFFPDSQRQKAMNKSYSIIFCMLLLVLASIGGVFAIKIALDGNATLESIVPSITQAVVIQVLNAVYRTMAVGMTDSENHQTDTQYEDNLVAKLYMFTFVNSYSALYFIAFIEGWTSLGCEKGSCLNYLAYSMMVLFITNLVVGNATEILVPLLAQRAKAAKESEGTGEKQKMSVAELQYTLETYDPTESTIEDFTTISIELGYVVLFAVAFPVAPFMAAVSEYVQIRTDGWKLCRAYKRCQPIGAQDIGIWASIFQLTTYASVISNAGIVMFTGTWFPYKLSTRIWMFILFQYVLVALMTGLDASIPDTPEDVEMQVERTAFFEKFIVEGAEPDGDKVDFDEYAHQHKKPHEVTYENRTHESQYHDSLDGSVFSD